MEPVEHNLHHQQGQASIRKMAERRPNFGSERPSKKNGAQAKIRKPKRLSARETFPIPERSSHDAK